MKGVSPVSETSTGMFHTPDFVTFCSEPLGSALYCTLNSTMRPLIYLHGVSLFHWTEMEEEL